MSKRSVKSVIETCIAHSSAITILRHNTVTVRLGPHFRWASDEHHTPNVRVEARNEAMAVVIAETLEQDLELLGLTGVEDKLQDDVCGTLELLYLISIRKQNVKECGIIVRYGCLLGIRSRWPRSFAISTKLSWSLVISAYTRSPSVSIFLYALAVK